MLLKEILRAHHQFSDANSIKNNIGDGFLLEHNPVFFNVRTVAKKMGFKYTPERLHDYETLALTQLPIILKKKQIPYLNNVRPLIEIEKNVPNYYSWSEIPPLKENFLLHESAHTVARTVRLKRLGVTTLKNNLSTDQAEALNLLIEEAFANACESTANIFSTTAEHDEFLYKNSYIMEKGRSRIVLRENYKLFGGNCTFKIVFLSFLYANFLKTRSAQKDFKRVRALVFGVKYKSKTRKEDSILKELFEIGFDLDPAFTISTNQFCLRLHGIKSDFYDVLAFDFLERFETDKKFQSLLNEFAQLIFPL